MYIIIEWCELASLCETEPSSIEPDILRQNFPGESKEAGVICCCRSLLHICGTTIDRVFGAIQ